MDGLHEIPISAPPARVFEAWTTAAGLRASWTTDVTVPASGGGHYVFGFDQGRVKFQDGAPPNRAGVPSTDRRAPNCASIRPRPPR
jgi:uncharacterized protein YndB with AHSA1/START domain